jgi:hypothetical protein
MIGIDWLVIRMSNSRFSLYLDWKALGFVFERIALLIYNRAVLLAL